MMVYADIREGSVCSQFFKISGDVSRERKVDGVY